MCVHDMAAVGEIYMNIWTGTGRLTKEPEVRYTKSGKCVCRLNIAVDDGYGENKRTDFIPATVWGKFGEVCSRNLVKGQKVTIAGKIAQNIYEKNGVKWSAIEVIAREVQFGAKPKGYVGQVSGDSGELPGTVVSEDDIPF